MRALMLLCLIAVAVNAAEIPAGTHLLLRMENTLNSRTADEGDYVYMRTANPVTVSGAVVIPAGSYVQGVVTRAKRAGRISGRAELGIRLEKFTLASGTEYKLSPQVASVDDARGTGQDVAGKEGVIREGSTTGQDAARVLILAGTGAVTGAWIDRGARGAGIGAGAGAAVGLATVLGTRGRDLMLQQGASLDVVFDRAVDLAQ
jgi:hypothetical protein